MQFFLEMRDARTLTTIKKFPVMGSKHTARKAAKKLANGHRGIFVNMLDKSHVFIERFNRKEDDEMLAETRAVIDRCINRKDEAL